MAVIPIVHSHMNRGARTDGANNECKLTLVAMDAFLCRTGLSSCLAFMHSPSKPIVITTFMNKSRLVIFYFFLKYKKMKVFETFIHIKSISNCLKIVWKDLAYEFYLSCCNKGGICPSCFVVLLVCTDRHLLEKNQDLTQRCNFKDTSQYIFVS